MKMEILGAQRVILPPPPPRPPIYATTFPPSYFPPSSLVPESIPARRYGIAPNLFPQPVRRQRQQPTLYHEVGTTHGESGSLFAGNDTGRPDFAGLHPFRPRPFPAAFRKMQILSSSSLVEIVP